MSFYFRRYTLLHQQLSPLVFTLAATEQSSPFVTHFQLFFFYFRLIPQKAYVKLYWNGGVRKNKHNH